MKFVAVFPGKKRLESPVEKKKHANSKTEILSDGPEQQDKVKTESCRDPGWLSGLSAGLEIERLRVRVPAGQSGLRIFFSRVNLLC